MPKGPALGLLVLSTDETIEPELRAYLPGDARVYVSRVESGLEVTTDTLSSMERTLPTAMSLMPGPVDFDVVAYGCTSGTAVIGPDRIKALVGPGPRAVTEPVTALLRACRALGLERPAFLSPYVEDVSAALRTVLDTAGVATPVFGSFNEGREEKVVRISDRAIIAAAQDLVRGQDVDGLILSCTNLRTRAVIDPLETVLNLPVISSNQALAWDICRRLDRGFSGPGRLGDMV